ncbi:hypothetical protein VTK56DRAFT_1977 [Thermocarpiscus australiensis]
MRVPRPGFLPQRPGVRTIFDGRPIFTHYVDLPPNYKDEDGLAFAKRDLDAREVVELFGPKMSTTAANKLLRILHGRRVAGTLEDPTVRINTMHFTKEEQKIALEYLRKHVPVDEIANAGLRAEDELAAMESPRGEMEAETNNDPGYTTKLKLYKDADGQSKSSSVYGPSAFDAIRARNQAKWEAELKRQEEEKRKRDQEQIHGKPGGLQLWREGQRNLNPKRQAYREAAESPLTEAPQMTKWQRLLPSAVLVLLVTGLAVTYAESYRPPKRTDRLFPDIPPAASTAGVLIMANVLIWGLWKVAPLWKFFNKYLVIVPATPRAAHMVAAMFSHQVLAHLVPNMVLLWVLGTRLHDEVGRGNFLATYFASGSIAALGSLSYAVLTNQLHMSSLGASGAVYGIGAAYLWLHRFDYFRILGLPPPPSEGIQGLIFLALAAGTNVAGYFTTRRFKIDITSHLVGMGVGVLAGFLLEKKKEARRRLQKGNAVQTGGVGKATLASRG